MKKIKGNFGKVIINDCIEEMDKLDNNSYEICITDPPYNVKYEADRIVTKEVCLYSDNKSYDEYKAWCISWFEEIKRITAGQAITCGNTNIAMWYSMETPVDLGLHYKPNSNGRASIAYLSMFDAILFYGKFKHRIPSLVIYAPMKRTNLTHPCPKTYDFWFKLIRGFKPTSVLDPFIGSGTTARVCESLGVNYIGFEIKHDYIDDIKQQIEAGIKYYRQFGNPIKRLTEY